VLIKDYKEFLDQVTTKLRGDWFSVLNIFVKKITKNFAVVLEKKKSQHPYNRTFSGRGE